MSQPDPDRIRRLETDPLMSCSIEELKSRAEAVAVDNADGTVTLDWDLAELPPPTAAVPARRERPSLNPGGLMLPGAAVIVLAAAGHWIPAVLLLLFCVAVAAATRPKAGMSWSVPRHPPQPVRAEEDWVEALRGVDSDVAFDAGYGYTFRCRSRYCMYSYMAAPTRADGWAGGVRHYLEHETKITTGPPRPGGSS